MRIILFLSLFVPMLAVAQTQDVFVCLDGVQGDVDVMGYKGCMSALTFESDATTNTQFDFTINVSVPSGTLKNAMTAGKIWRSGTIAAVMRGVSPVKVLYTVKMTGVKVLKCAESMGCNNVMTTGATISAQRVEWTYYQYDEKGVVKGTSVVRYPT